MYLIWNSFGHQQIIPLFPTMFSLRCFTAKAINGIQWHSHSLHLTMQFLLSESFLIGYLLDPYNGATDI